MKSSRYAAMPSGIVGRLSFRSDPPYWYGCAVDACIDALPSCLGGSRGPARAAVPLLRRLQGPPGFLDNLRRSREQLFDHRLHLLAGQRNDVEIHLLGLGEKLRILEGGQESCLQ